MYRVRVEIILWGGLLAGMFAFALSWQNEREMSRHLEAAEAEAASDLHEQPVASVGWSETFTGDISLAQDGTLRYRINGQPATREEFERWLVRYLSRGRK